MLASACASTVGWRSAGQQDRGAEAGARRDRSEVSERRERFEPRLGDDAVAHPQVHARRVGKARDRPTLLDRRTPRGLQHDGAVGKQDS